MQGKHLLFPRFLNKIFTFDTINSFILRSLKQIFRNFAAENDRFRSFSHSRFS